jgi:hypothetical protein
MDDLCTKGCSQTCQDFSSQPNAKRAKNTINQFDKVEEVLKVKCIVYKEILSSISAVLKTSTEVFRLMRDDI